MALGQIGRQLKRHRGFIKRLCIGTSVDATTWAVQQKVVITYKYRYSLRKINLGEYLSNPELAGNFFTPAPSN